MAMAAVPSCDLVAVRHKAVRKACLRIVVSAIPADVEPVRPARRKKASSQSQPFRMKVFPQGERSFPGGKLPPSTAGGTPAATFSDML